MMSGSKKVLAYLHLSKYSFCNWKITYKKSVSVYSLKYNNILSWLKGSLTTLAFCTVDRRQKYVAVN